MSYIQAEMAANQQTLGYIYSAGILDHDLIANSDRAFRFTSFTWRVRPSLPMDRCWKSLLEPETKIFVDMFQIYFSTLQHYDIIIIIIAITWSSHVLALTAWSYPSS